MIKAERILRRFAQSLTVARAVKPTGLFLLDAARDSRAGSYVSRRTGQTVHLRARRDLQVACELVSREGYPYLDLLRSFEGAVEVVNVIDVGANIGLFTLDVTYRLPLCTVISVEPDPYNLSLLRKNIHSNALDTRVRICPVAASTASGTLRFSAGRNHISRAAALADDGLGEMIDVPTADFFALAADVDLVKMDIEGGRVADSAR